LNVGEYSIQVAAGVCAEAVGAIIIVAPQTVPHRAAT
jgi:hypothetical protein